MGSEVDISIKDAFEASSLARIIKEGQVKTTIERLIEQHGPAVMNPRSDGTSVLNSFALLGSYDAVSFLLEKGAVSSVLQADGSSILHSVVRTTEQPQDSNRSKLLALILESGNEVLVNHRNNKGWTPLKLAAKKGLEQCVEVLLNHGADPNISDDEGYLPLHNAVGNKDVVKLLTSSTNNINERTHKGETPLYLSVEYGNVACSLMLLEHGADPNISNKDGITPLFLASRSGSVALVRELLRRKADPNAAGASQAITPLHWAAHKENAEIALLLIEFGADVQQKDKEGRIPLSLASRDLAAKMIEQVSKLRNHRIEVASPSQMTSLSKAMAACCGGNVPALQALLQSGISPNQICDSNNNSTLLHMAAYCGQIAIVALLFNNDADWNLRDTDGDTVLHFACMKNSANGNYIATLKFLLSTPAKALIDVQNARGDTPLHVAIRCTFSDRAKVLVQHNANVMIVNKKKEFPLHRACCSDLNMEVIMYLSDLVPDINTQDGDGWTALMYAARSNCTSVLKYLLQRKADPNIQQSSQYTALHLAAQENLPEICSILLYHNANPNILGGDQKVSSLHIAAHKGFKEVCHVLVEGGADSSLTDNDNDTPLSLTDNEEIKSIIRDTPVAPSRVRSNSNPSNSPTLDRQFLQKRHSKEDCDLPFNESELKAKLEEKEMMFEKMFKNLKQLKEDNMHFKSRIWELEGDLRQKEMATRLASIPEDERVFRQRWWMIDIAEIEQTDKLLNSSTTESLRFWNVHLGAYRVMDVGVKEIVPRICEATLPSDVKKTFFREVDQLSRLQCPQIVQFFGAFCEPESNRYGIVIEYLPNGNLSDLIHKHDHKLEKLQKMKIVRDIALGMSYLHSFPVLHRALRPQNILMGEHLNARISDFGFHETKKISGYIDCIKSKCKELKKPDFPVYTAPEVFERNEFSKASDVYSFGMTVYEIVTGNKPFSDSDPQQKLCVLMMKIIMGGRPTIPADLPATCQENISKAWHSSPSSRPTFKMLRQHIIHQIQNYQQDNNDLDDAAN